MKDVEIKVSSNVQINKYVLASYNTLDDLPTVGDVSVLYLVYDTNFIYYWNGQKYCVIYSSGAQAITLEEIDSIINDWSASNE